MLNIPCPWCGPRDETEFHYGQEAGVEYPENRDNLKSFSGIGSLGGERVLTFLTNGR